jgi:hypothetical protein
MRFTYPGSPTIVLNSLYFRNGSQPILGAMQNSMPQYPAYGRVPGVPRRGWSRNPWAIGLTILSGCLIFVIVLVVSVFALLSHSEAAKLSIATAQSNPVLVQQLGTPLKTGRFITGNINLQNDSGQAELTIPISGPKGKGTLYSEASKAEGIWHLKSLRFARSGSDDRVDLLPNSEAQPGVSHP